MNIKLVKLSKEYKTQFIEMIEEWKTDIEKNNTNHSPWAIFKNDYHDFDSYVATLERKEEIDGLVPNSVFFCLDLDRNIFVGAVDIRHYLNDSNRLTGGHIGDGIRPSERRKGYATTMLGLALEECRKMGLNKVLITCAKNNIGSAKSIINNGGEFEGEIEENGEIEQRYWITLYEEILESERMLLRRVMPLDYEEMAAWTMDEKVYEYLLSNPVNDPKEAMIFLRRNDPNSTNIYIMIEHSKSDGHAIGLVSAHWEEEKNAWEISYNCKHDDWNKGYTYEGAKTLINYIIKKHNATTFIGECAYENIGSSRVMEKLGMTYDHDSSYTKRDGSKTFKSKVYKLSI